MSISSSLRFCYSKNLVKVIILVFPTASDNENYTMLKFVEQQQYTMDTKGNGSKGQLLNVKNGTACKEKENKAGKNTTKEQAQPTIYILSNSSPDHT